MKPKLLARITKRVFPIFIIGLLVYLTWLGVALAGSDSGLRLDLYIGGTAPVPTIDEATFNLRSPVPINMVIQVESKWPVHTLREFPEIELSEALIIKGPDGQEYKPDPDLIAADMPLDYSWNGRPVAPATTLPVRWARSIEIKDLARIVPVLAEQPGKYTISAKQSFIRFAWLVDVEKLGPAGLMDETKRNWQGTVSSENSLNIFITPLLGAKLKVDVLDFNDGNTQPINMRPVRIYRIKDLQDVDAGGEVDLAGIWSKEIPVLSGKTDLFEGWSVWDQGELCMEEGEYVAIAKYKGKYGSAIFEQQGVISEWKEKCGGLITRQILFGELPDQYSVFAKNSILLRNNVVVHGGDIGVLNELPGYEVVLENNVYTQDNVKIVADSVMLSGSSDVFAVCANTLDANGAMIREVLSPEKCVIPGRTWPEYTPVGFQTKSKDRDDLSVTAGVPVVLSSDGDVEFDNVTLSSGSVLELTGGTYVFKTLALGSDSKIVCTGSEPVEIRILEHLYPGTKSYIGPSPVARPSVLDQNQYSGDLNASDIRIVVQGQDGSIKKDNLSKSYPEAATLGEGSVVRANVFVPGGTLTTKQGCELEGSFIAKDVILGQDANVWINSPF